MRTCFGEKAGPAVRVARPHGACAGPVLDRVVVTLELREGGLLSFTGSSNRLLVEGLQSQALCQGLRVQE